MITPLIGSTVSGVPARVPDGDGSAAANVVKTITKLQTATTNVMLTHDLLIRTLSVPVYND